MSSYYPHTQCLGDRRKAGFPVEEVCAPVCVFVVTGGVIAAEWSVCVCVYIRSPS